ncbi:MAG: DUF5615 family PIN-like protein [Acidobacteria bacterium]|nr:DUF5615 family PIN-like protein [Acidobacteriota bacterium]
MRVRFQADADLDARIVRGVKRRQPGIDFQLAAESDLWGLPDPEVLQKSADAGRVLVTHDRRTMPRHFSQYIVARTSSGVIVVPKAVPIGIAVDIAVEDLVLVWAASNAEEWRNRLAWIPL